MNRTSAEMPKGSERAKIWPMTSWPRLLSAAERVTSRPVAVLTSSAGIWVTRPTPIVSRV